jgi:hypothetical protein
MDSAARPRVLALNIAAGTVYGAVVSCPDILDPDAVERLQLAEGMESHEQLADFAARFQQDLRQIAPIAVGVVNTRLYANWKYADAFKRVSVEATIMLTVAQTSTAGVPIAYKLIKQESMAKAMDIPLPKLAEIAEQRWGGQVPRYRKDRLPAVVGAMALAKEFCAE